jgi:hypothetical protein
MGFAVRRFGVAGGESNRSAAGAGAILLQQRGIAGNVPPVNDPLNDFGLSFAIDSLRLGLTCRRVETLRHAAAVILDGSPNATVGRAWRSERSV